MPRVLKFEDSVYAPTFNWGKVFIYNDPTWGVLYPIVDIIRILPKGASIAFKNGPGQGIIRNYSSQYNYTTMGFDIKTKEDYLDVIYKGKVKFIFIFSDKQDAFSKNLLDFGEKFGINTICYSNLDKQYHCYSFNVNTPVNQPKIFKTPSEVMEHMQSLNELNIVSKFNDLFPEYNILQGQPDQQDQPVNPVQPNQCNLEDCMEKMKIISDTEKEKKKASKNYPVAYDPHMFKLKKMEYFKTQRKINYDEPDLSEKVKKPDRSSNNDSSSTPSVTKPSVTKTPVKTPVTKPSVGSISGLFTKK